MSGATAREVLVVEPGPHLATLFEALVEGLGRTDVHVTIEEDRARAAARAPEFDLVLRDAPAMLAFLNEMIRAAKATAEAENDLALDNRW